MLRDYEPVHNADLQLEDLTTATNSTTGKFLSGTSTTNESQGLLSARTTDLTTEHRDGPLSSASRHSAGGEAAIDNETSSRTPRPEDFGAVIPKITASAQAKPQPSEQDDDSQHGTPTMADPTRTHAVCVSHSTRSFVYRLWLWEVAASVFSLACMAAVVGVLLYEDGRRLDEWSFGSYSPTVVVSFLGTLAKSASVLVITEVISQLKWLHFHSQPRSLNDLQLFDRASRGPWGALNLAFFKNRKALTASCASALMLCFLLFDPFTQSVFRFPVILSAVQDAKTSILTSLEYDPLSSTVSLTNTCPHPLSIYSKMQAAIISPILNNTQPPTLPCAFEKCEWPTITTLGVCSSCVDLTETVIPACVADDSRWTTPIRCNYTVPLTNSTFPAVFGRYGGATSAILLSTVWGSKAERELLGDASYELPGNRPVKDSYPASLADFTFVQLPPDTFHGDYLINNSLKSFPPIRRAMRCKFELCARTFTKPYYANFLSSPLTGPQAPLIRSTKDTIRVGVPLQSGFDGYKTLIGLKSSNSTELSVETVFRINYCDWENIGNYLVSLFTATQTNVGASISENDDIRWTPNLGIALSQADDVEALVRDMADSMTDAMRTSPNSTQHNGIALSSVTYIEIVWERLVLPLCTIILSSILLIIIIIRNRVRGVPAWKSSSLALLFHRLEGWSDDELNAHDLAYLDEKSVKMKGQVLSGDDGKLVFFNTA